MIEEPAVAAEAAPPPRLRKKPAAAPYDDDRLLAWHRSIVHDPQNPPRDEKGKRRRVDRAAAARLRRCETPMDVWLEPAMAAFVAMVIKQDQRSSALQDDRKAAGLARIAGLAVHLRQPDMRHDLAAQLVGMDDTGTFTQRRTVRPERVRRLIQTAEPAEAFVQWRRLLPVLKGQANLLDLADAIYFWDDDARRTLARRYFEHTAKAEFLHRP